MKNEHKNKQIKNNLIDLITISYLSLEESKNMITQDLDKTVNYSLDEHEALDLLSTIDNLLNKINNLTNKLKGDN